MGLPLGDPPLPSVGDLYMCASEERQQQRDGCAGSPEFFLRCCHFPVTAMKIRGLSAFSQWRKEDLPLLVVFRWGSGHSPSLRHA